MASVQRHWETIYRTKGEEELSWHQDEPTVSLRLIRSVADPGSKVIDVGGGTSVLARRLIDQGFDEVTVLDIADPSIGARRIPPRRESPKVRSLKADVTKIQRIGRFDVWHDRALFHFLIDPADRRAYIRLARKSLSIGGHVILGTFAPDGPAQCSGLEVVRYDVNKLATEFSSGFRLVRGVREVHVTPWGTKQPFQYVVLQRVPAVASAAPKPSQDTDLALGPKK